MKTLKGFVNEEQINEDIASTALSCVLIMQCITYLCILIGIGKLSDDEGMFDSIKYLWKNRKVKKIAKRLSEDTEVKAFLDQPKSKQKGWKKLIETKLSDEEKKYLHSISRDNVSQNYK